MANDIRIGVSADTSGVKAGLAEVDKAAQNVSGSMSNVGQAGDAAAKGVDKIEISVKRLERAAAALSKEFGRAVSPRQADTVLRQFEAMRANKHLSGASKIRQFDSFEGWMAGSSSLFVNPTDHERHRRRILNLAAQGTGLATAQEAGGGQKGPPPSSQRPAPAGGSDNHRSAIVQRGMGSVKGMVGGAFALAGVMGVMAMAGRSVDLARQEAIAQDQLLRGTGDLAREFGQLRTDVRYAGHGLGVAYAEAAALTRQFTQLANADADTDIAGNMRTGYGLARAYGLELSEGVSAIGQAREFGGIASNDANGRRFALMIAEAIERGNSTAKAGEMLAAIANYTSTIARAALTAPNVAGFAGALSSLTASHTPGLDPSGAANLLMGADAAVRAGGGMGEAGQNFTYGALLRVNPGLHPIMSQAIAEQGLMGSGQDLGRSPLAGYLAAQGRSMPILSSQSNFDVLRSEVTRQYDDPMMRLDALKNFFGLGSLQHAAAFANMDPHQLDGLESLLGRAGVRMDEVSASGIQNLGAIGSADDRELRRIFERVSGRDDITALERRRLEEAAGSGDAERLREELARVVAIYEQERNVATETRDAIADLNNTLTTIGNGLLPVVAGIQSGVAALVGSLAPESEYARQLRLEQGVGAYRRDREDMLARHQADREGQEAIADARNIPESRREPVRELLAEHQRAELEAFDRANHHYVEYLRQRDDGTGVESVDNALERLRESGGQRGPLDLGLEDPVPTPGEQRSGQGLRVGNIDLSDDELRSLQAASGGDPELLRFLLTVLAIENRGFGHVDNHAVSPAGALGGFQFMPATAAGYGLDDPTDFDQSASAAAQMARDLHRQYNGDMRAMLAHYNGGTANGRAVARGGDALNPETREYVRLGEAYNDGGLLRTGSRGTAPDLGEAPSHGGRLPAGNPAGRPTQEFRVVADLRGTLHDQQGQEIGELEAPTIYSSLPVAAGM